MNRIRFLRVQRGMKQEELARAIHVSQSSLSGYENGKYEPDTKTLLNLASYFGVSTDYLLGFDPPRASKRRLFGQIPVYAHLRSENFEGPLHNILYFLDFKPFPEADGEYFGILVGDGCMEPRIQEGDVVIARRQRSVRTGEMAVLQIGRKNAEVKRVLRHPGGITLLPYNPRCRAITYTEEEITGLPVMVLGKAVEFLGKC